MARRSPAAPLSVLHDLCSPSISVERGEAPRLVNQVKPRWTAEIASIVLTFRFENAVAVDDVGDVRILASPQLGRQVSNGIQKLHAETGFQGLGSLRTDREQLWERRSVIRWRMGRFWNLDGYNWLCDSADRLWTPSDSSSGSSSCCAAAVPWEQLVLESGDPMSRSICSLQSPRHSSWFALSKFNQFEAQSVRSSSIHLVYRHEGSHLELATALCSKSAAIRAEDSKACWRWGLCASWSAILIETIWKPPLTCTCSWPSSLAQVHAMKTSTINHCGWIHLSNYLSVCRSLDRFIGPYISRPIRRTSIEAVRTETDRARNALRQKHWSAIRFVEQWNGPQNTRVGSSFFVPSSLFCFLAEVFESEHTHFLFPQMGFSCFFLRHKRKGKRKKVLGRLRIFLFQGLFLLSFLFSFFFLQVWAEVWGPRVHSLSLSRAFFFSGGMRCDSHQTRAATLGSYPERSSPEGHGELRQGLALAILNAKSRFFNSSKSSHSG